MHRTTHAIVGLSLLFATGPALAGQDPPVPKKAESLTSILERIRQDVGYYEVQAARRRNHIPTPPKQGMPDTALGVLPAAACDISDFDFDVTNVQANLQTVTVETENGSVGLSVPLFGKEGSKIDADGNWQDARTQTVKLTRRFHYNAEQLASYQDTKDYRQLETAHAEYRPRDASQATTANTVLPIASTLVELRENLIRSAEKLPCFEWTEDKEAKPENSITLEFLVQESLNGTVGFNFWVVSAEAGGKFDHTVANTLVVNFAPHAHVAPSSQSVSQQLGPAKG
jgi:hypothetical protein